MRLSRSAKRALFYGFGVAVWYFIFSRYYRRPTYTEEMSAVLYGAALVGALSGFLWYLLDKAWTLVNALEVAVESKWTDWLLESTMLEVSPEEHLLKESRANHLKWWFIPVGGVLSLTDQRIVFKPHRLNLFRREFSLPLDQIALTKPITSRKPQNWLFHVLTNTGRHVFFAVADRQAWEAALTATIGGPAAEGSGTVMGT